MSMSSSNGLARDVSGTPANTRRTAVFVVDDDAEVREALGSLISAAGWRPQLFAFAGDFLACPRPRVPSCLVLDVSLPDLNGLELQERIAAERATMPIIFITGHGDVPMTVRAMKAGAVEFLTKPFSGEEVLRAIGHALEFSREALQREAGQRTLRDRFALLTPRGRQ